MQLGPLKSAVVLWIALYSLVSFGLAYSFHVQINQIPGFYSSFSDVIIIGFILIFASLSVTLLLFLLLTFLIRISDKSRGNAILINTIILVLSVIAFLLIKYNTVSWQEALLFVSGYALAFLVVINIYFQKAERNQLD